MGGICQLLLVSVTSPKALQHHKKYVHSNLWFRIYAAAVGMYMQGHMQGQQGRKRAGPVELTQSSLIVPDPELSDSETAPELP